MSGHDSHPDDPLTPKEEVFINYYVQGYSAAKSAQLAKYKGYNQPHRIAHFPNVAKRISQLREEINEKSIVTAAQKVKLLWDLAEVNSNVYTEVDEEGQIHIAIAPGNEIRDPKISISAIQELNKMQGHYAPEKSEVTNNSSITVSDKELVEGYASKIDC